MQHAFAFLVMISLLLFGGSQAARGQAGFAFDPGGYSPGSPGGGFGYSGFGYSALGPRGVGYYVGLPDFTSNNGPSGMYSPIFNAMAAAPRDSLGLGPTVGGETARASSFMTPAPSATRKPVSSSSERESVGRRDRSLLGRLFGRR